MAQHTMSAASGDSASPSKQMAVTLAGAEALLLMPSSLHPVAQAVKPPAKTGDDLIDQDAMAKHRQKVIIVHGIMSDDTHVGALYDCLLSRLEARRACLYTDGGERFSAGKTLRTVDRDWRFDVLVEVSDIPARTLAAAQKADEANMVDLITFWTQLPPQMPLPEDCRIKMVLKSVLIRVAKLYKDRLNNFFASKLINADSGKIDWSKGVYSLTWNEDGKLAQVSHRSGDVATLPPGSVDKSWSLEDNFSDWHAPIVLAPLPPLKLHTLFKKKKSGPYTLPHITGPQNAAFKAIVAEVIADWQKQRGGGPAQMQHSDIKEEVALAERNIKQDRARKAREAAAHALAQKRARRTVTFE